MDVHINRESLVHIRTILDGSKFKDGVLSSCIYLKFPGSGQRETLRLQILRKEASTNKRLRGQPPCDEACGCVFE